MRGTNSRRAKAAKSSPRRRQQKLQRQEEILAAAFKVFAAHGYEAARIDDVARQAGIAKGTIYLYFRDKERLFRRWCVAWCKSDLTPSPEAFKGRRNIAPRVALTHV